MSPAGPGGALGATVAIVPVAEHHAEGFRACLDVVARERRYLAQIEEPPLERIEAFVRESVANDAAQFVAVDGGRVAARNMDEMGAVTGTRDGGRRGGGAEGRALREAVLIAGRLLRQATPARRVCSQRVAMTS